LNVPGGLDEVPESADRIYPFGRLREFIRVYRMGRTPVSHCQLGIWQRFSDHILILLTCP